MPCCHAANCHAANHHVVYHAMRYCARDNILHALMVSFAIFSIVRCAIRRTQNSQLRAGPDTAVAGAPCSFHMVVLRKFSINLRSNIFVTWRQRLQSFQGTPQAMPRPHTYALATRISKLTNFNIHDLTFSISKCVYWNMTVCAWTTTIVCHMQALHVHTHHVAYIILMCRCISCHAQ
jgi:hypothetical protein